MSKPKEVEEFDSYVEKGYYSSWYKVNLTTIGKKATEAKAKIIREYRVAQFPELEDCLIRADGTVDDVEKTLLGKIKNVIAGEFVRIMVGAHDVYIEFISDIDCFKYIKNHIHYVEYEDKYGNKLYHQTKTVNYADYKPDLWYVAFKDIMKVINEG